MKFKLTKKNELEQSKDDKSSTHPRGRSKFHSAENFAKARCMFAKLKRT